MKEAVRILIDREIEQLKDEYKRETGRKRVSKSMEFTSDKIEQLKAKLKEL